MGHLLHSVDVDEVAAGATSIFLLRNVPFRVPLCIVFVVGACQQAHGRRIRAETGAWVLPFSLRRFIFGIVFVAIMIIAALQATGGVR